MDKVAAEPHKEKKEKIFSIKNFIEKEAEEEIELDKKGINKTNPISLKDTQHSSEENNPEDDSYGISSDNDTEKVEEQMISNRALLNQEKMKKDKFGKIKRKSVPLHEKKDNKKRKLKYIEKNSKKVDKILGIINGKLNICFEENRENKDINNINVNTIKTPEKKFKDEDDEDVLLLKMSNERKNISNANKNNNLDFIKRMKENENFIRKNNIIVNDENKRSKSQILRRNTEKILFHPKLKLYNMKGVFLNKKKK